LRCYYEVLGVERNASSGEIASAYRKLAVKFHPDKNPGDDEAIARFKEASAAFEVLSDSDKRSRYDRFGHAGVNGNGQGAGFGDVEDIFSAFGDIFGDLFGGRGRGGRRRTRRGRDVECEVRLTLLEAATGARKTVEFQRSEPCADCDGSGAAPGSARVACSYCGGHGQVVQQAGIVRMQTTCPACHGAGTSVETPCRTCRGSGRRPKRVQVDVDIPAGVDNGMQIRISGQGEPSESGGPPGDCYCVVRVEEHELFERQGQHLVCRVPITYPQAVLGAELEIPTLSGRTQVRIKPGTQSGDVIVVEGQGLRDPRVSGVGDLLVQVTIHVPKKTSHEEQELLRKLAEVEQTNVAPERKSFLDKLKDYFTQHEGV
ncbi:MAG: molecular chaperone DnaJ, partial [Planctomycetales bacterium]|nr:molecular chaperone DnaJ [Planctomycetales bacterium]